MGEREREIELEIEIEIVDPLIVHSQVRRKRIIRVSSLSPQRHPAEDLKLVACKLLNALIPTSAKPRCTASKASASFVFEGAGRI